MTFFPYAILGQSAPECFEEGECTDSLILDVWHDIENSETCLETCQESVDCNYFTFYEEDNSCLSFANCVTFSTDTCTDCYSGDRSCIGETNITILLFHKICEM